VAAHVHARDGPSSAARPAGAPRNSIAEAVCGPRLPWQHCAPRALSVVFDWPRNRWAADALWPCGRQVAAVGAQSCENLWDIDVYPGSSGSTTIGNGCSSSGCRGNNNGDCDAWHVQCASGRRARLTFEFFQTESNYDYLCARQLLLLRLVAQKASPSCLVPTVIPAPNAICRIRAVSGW
jgi:hypothetical protein